VLQLRRAILPSTWTVRWPSHPLLEHQRPLTACARVGITLLLGGRFPAVVHDKASCIGAHIKSGAPRIPENEAAALASLHPVIAAPRLEQ